MRHHCRAALQLVALVFDIKSIESLSFFGCLFPARAGMNRSTSSSASGSPGVPRTRGDEPILLYGVEGIGKCSPHARG